MDEIQKIVLEVQGQEKLHALNSELAKEQDALSDLAGKLRTGAIQQAAFDQAAATSAGNVARLRGEMEQLIGRRGMSGSGLLNASYAAQDFTSVLTGGGGLDRALSSVQNNVAPLLQSFGVLAGPAGLISLISVGVGLLVPQLERLWGSLEDSEAAKIAAERLKELKEQIKETHEAFKALAEMPTDPERAAAEGVAGFLAVRPNAERAAAAAAAGMTNAEIWGSVTPDKRKEWRALEAKASATDEDLERRVAEAQMNMPAGMYGDDPVAMREDAERRMASAREDREKARKRMAEIMAGGRTAAAEAIVVGATQAGPAGQAARRRLQELADGVPGLKELSYYTPERIAADEAEFARGEEKAADDDAAYAAVKRHNREARRKRKEATDHAKRMADLGVRQLVQDRAEEIRQAKEDKAEERRAVDDELNETWHKDAINHRKYEVGKKKRPFFRARRAVIQASVDNGIGMPTDHQADEMANEVIALQRENVGLSAAVMYALQRKVQEISSLRAQIMQMRAQASNFGMGVDHNAQFSAMPPMFGGGFGFSG